MGEKGQAGGGGRVRKIAGPSPDPSPEGKGSDHRDTPMG